MRKVIKFKNGDRYNGEVNAEGQPQGSGHMDYNLNGYYAEYDGQWKDGKRCGKGHYYRFSKGGGARHSYDYKGEWLDDKEHGQGVSKECDEIGVHMSSVTEQYTGGFYEGKRHGHGMVVVDNFDGNFTNGKNRFEGEFVDGKMTGHGVWHYANGDSFEGEFVNGYRNGHGIYTFASGIRFEGEWKDNHFDIDSYQADSSHKTPSLLVTEHHHGFDYSYSGTFLLVVEEGTMCYENAAVIEKDNSFQMSKGSLKIIEVTSDSVTYEVKSDFAPGYKSFNDTIRRGESKEYQNSKDCVATIYDEDYDYSIESRLYVTCR